MFSQTRMPCIFDSQTSGYLEILTSSMHLRFRINDITGFQKEIKRHKVSMTIPEESCVNELLILILYESLMRIDGDYRLTRDNYI